MKDFWVHLGAQIGMAAAGAAVTSAAGANYSNLGVWAGVAQAVAAIAAEIYNQFVAKSAAPAGATKSGA
jgi:hypothetical protein